MATARITGGYGVAPSYGAQQGIIKPKTSKSTWAGAAQGTGGMGSAAALRAGLAANIAAQPAATAMPAAPAPSASAAAASWDPNSMAPDPLYTGDIATNQRTHDDTITGLEGQKTSVLGDFGYSATYKPDGTLDHLTYDPNNPYSRAAQLNRAAQITQTGTRTDMAAGGHLNSSAFQHSKDFNDNSYNTQSNALQQSLGSIIAGIIGQERTADTGLRSANNTALGNRITRLPQNPLAGASADTAAAPAASPNPVLATIQGHDGPVQVTGANWVKTQYTNPQGHPVKVFADGHREVSTDGGRTWKRV